MTPQPAACDIVAAWMASEMEPIWLTFKSNALQAPTSNAFAMRVGFVTNKSSPTIWYSLPTTSMSIL
eukprot:CAMPEP_0177333356 /NCGR_PEP_ID=MMETSP0368-20130122/22122_1 /TAXON_ID=447022 ORGANISM="Scrippsiella hangoei-like, Strain SHHI-4" /NCGR_SAMPLE_ID=MMETSP0368 /ASSEMBLY_ACC=CAM_ASM_000363 /LENGTH=66 /DNA_ID=CAMNT_0018793963 /DNA_START=25 /DNA_END=225 /DNA_ORIENTATION=-